LSKEAEDKNLLQRIKSNVSVKLMKCPKAYGNEEICKA
jgi:hypothetical protein